MSEGKRETGQNRRASKRKKTLIYLKVYDGRGKELGRVVDMSIGGVLLVHSRPLLPRKKPFSITMALPRALKDESPLRFIVSCRWTALNAENEELHRSGLQFLNLTPAKLHILNKLTNYFSFEGGSIIDPPARKPY